MDLSVSSTHPPTHPPEPCTMRSSWTVTSPRRKGR